MMDFLYFPLDITKRFRLNHLSCWRLMNEMQKHPRCNGLWRPFSGQLKVPCGLKDWSVLCHDFSIHHRANPTLSRLPCVSPFCPINTHFRNDLIKQQIYLPLAFGQVPGFRRPSSSLTLERDSQDAGIRRNTVSGVWDLCLTSDRFPLTCVSTHKNSELDRKPDSHFGQGNRTLHFAAGFVKSSVSHRSSSWILFCLVEHFLQCGWGSCSVF